METPLDALEEAVNRVGERWTLLVIRALIDSPRRFNQLQELLPGLAPTVLTKRLRQLEADGVVVAEPYSRRPLRMEYQLTQSGRDLADALLLLAQWGAARGAAPAPVRHEVCGTPLEARWYCPTCARLAEPGSDEDRLYHI
jgi:DNA-binding HxlR family transcriptional regulator